MTTIPVTKIDVARRQTDTAITLWFHDGDPVSIHTLGSAALTVLHDLGSRGGEPAMTYNPKNFREGMFDEWRNLANKSQNFFKHADRKPDPTAIHDFRPSTNQFMLSDCVDTYHRLTGEKTPIMIVFWNYFTVHHPQYFNSITLESISEELRTLSKGQFFKECLSAVHVHPTTTAQQDEAINP